MIRVYGDSYTAPKGVWTGKIDHRPTWINDLAIRLNQEVLNQAVSGASTERAFKLMYRDCYNGEIHNGDVVIFTVSSPGRIHFEYINDQKPGQSTIANYIDAIESNTPSKLFLQDRVWLKDHVKEIKWWLANADLELINMTYGAFVGWIRDQAMANKAITWVVLYKEMPKYLSYSRDVSDNFIEFKRLLDDINLAEIYPRNFYSQFTKYTDWDPRGNHFTNQNTEILVSGMTEAIVKQDAALLNNLNFVQDCIDVIKNKSEYQRYIDLGIINYCEYIFDKLPD
jgi:hypothetical protein